MRAAPTLQARILTTESWRQLGRLTTVTSMPISRREQLKSRIFLGLVLALCSVIQGADKAQTMKIKPGLWEVTTTVARDTEIPIPAGLLEKLTPEQRARVEERRNTKSSEAQMVIKKKYCLSRDELTQGPTFGQDRKSCKPIVVASTAKSLTMRIECASQSPQSQTWEMEAAGLEQVTGSARATIGADQAQIQTSRRISAFSARWIAPTCSSSK